MQECHVQAATDVPSHTNTTLAPAATPLADDVEGGRLGSVFAVSVAVCALFVGWAVLFTDNLNKFTTSSLNWLTASFGWAYL